MELEIKTNLSEVMPKEIEGNYAPLKAELADKLAYYKALVVTEDSAKIAKSDLAWLRKLKVLTLRISPQQPTKFYLLQYNSSDVQFLELQKEK